MVTSPPPGPAHITSIAELEEEVARRITALDASRFQLEGLPVVQRWHESREPLTALESTVGCQHLAFSCSVENAPFGDDDSGGASGLLTTDAELVIIFLYKLPATDRLAAMRLASEAARNVMKAMLAGWAEVSVTPRNAYRPGPVDANGFVPVELRFTCRFDMSV